MTFSMTVICLFEGMVVAYLKLALNILLCVLNLDNMYTFVHL